MRRNKGLRLDHTELLGLDNSERIHVCLTQRQVAILKAVLIPQYWETRWTNLSITKDELESAMAEIDYRLDGHDCEGIENMQFRDNPTDLCEVQYSVDDGETWSTMFRKDNCLEKTSVIDIDTAIETNTYVTNNHTVWEGDIVNVAPDWEYVDQFSDRAICWAIDMYVDAMCDTAILQIKSDNAERRDENDWVEDLIHVFSGTVIAAIAATATASVLWPALAVAAIGWASAKIVDSILDELADEDYIHFEDEDIRTQIKCMMYFSVKGATPQFTAWSDSLSYFSSMGHDAQVVARYLNVINQDEDTYINFLLLTEDINTLGEALPECPCVEEWAHFWDFENEGMEAWVLTGQMYGEYEDEVGMNAVHVTPVTISHNIIQNLTLDEIIPNCTAFRVHYTVVKGTFDSNVDALQIYVPPVATESQTQGWLFTGTDEWQYNFDETELTSCGMFMQSCSTETPGWGELKVTGITLKGNGPDPFFGRDTG